jgi:hypothetical protein
MAKCLNCGKALSCGCQKRTASNGKQVCSGCLKNYESSLKEPTTTTTKESTLNEFGKNRYNRLQKFIK